MKFPSDSKQRHSAAIHPSLSLKRCFGHWLLAAALPLLATKLSAAEIVLIDYNDGNAGNGVHDTAVNDGDFSLQTNSALVSALPWVTITSTQYLTTNASGIGSTLNWAATGGTNAADARRIGIDASGSSGYTIDVGHTLNASFMIRPAANWDVNDTMGIRLFYTADDTLSGSATTLGEFVFTGRNNAAWSTETFDPVIVTDSGAVGKKLFASLQTATPGATANGEFARMDNIFVSVENTPVSPILVVAPSFSFTGAGGGSFSIPVSNPAAAGVTTDLTITGVTPTGTDAAGVSITSTFNLVVAPNGSSQIEFTFTPGSGPGTYNFNLEIASNDATQASPRIVPVQIEIQPSPSLTAAATFTALNDGTATPYTIPISNNAADGITALSISNVQATGADALDVSNIGFPASLAAGASGSITFDFEPSDGAGPYTFDIEITSTDQSQVSPRTIPVTINVRDPVISVAATSLNFGNFVSSPAPQVLALSVTNDGGATDLTIDNIASGISGASEFTVTSYPGPIAPGATAEIEITFTPGAEEGLFTGTLTIVSNDFAGIQPQIALRAFVFPAGNHVAAVDFGTAGSVVAPSHTQFVAAEGAAKTIGGVGVQITSRDGNIAAGTGAGAGDLMTDFAATTFNGAAGNYISVVLSGLKTGTLNLVASLNYNSTLALPTNIAFGEVGGSFNPVAANLARPGEAEYTTTVEAGKSYELRITENGNANLAYLSGLLLWGDAVPGGTPFGNFVAAAGLDPATTGLPGLDPDLDGVDTGIEWLVGGSPNDPANPDTGKLPTGAYVLADPDGNSSVLPYLLVTYRRSDEAFTDPSTTILPEYSSGLQLWQPALDGFLGVVVKVTNDGAEAGVDLVEVYLPVSLASSGQLFGRIKTSIATP